MGGAKGLLLIIKNGPTNHENLPPPLKRPGTYTQEQLLSWKQLEAYNFFESGYVRTVFAMAFGQDVAKCVLVKAKVNPSQRRGGSRNLGRGGGGAGRGWVREGDVPPPAQSAEALSNIAILTHIHNEKLALIT